MRFSVVIPTYNEGDSLQLCLDALRKQTFQGSYQVIVVDNGSTVNIPEVDAADPLVKLVKEPTPGSYSARNTGIRHAEGEIIAFTDSDCIPDAGWLESADRVLAQDKDVALLAGRVRIFYEDARNPTAVELFENQYSFKQDENVKQGWAVTANVFVRRAVIDDIGVFNTATFSGGDSEFTRRAVEAGYQLAYSHDAAVQHPARRTMEELRQLRRRHVGGFYKLSKVHAEFGEMFSLVGILKDFLYPVKGGLQLLGKSLRGQLPLGEAIKVFWVLAYTRCYRGLLKLSYKLQLKNDYER